VDNNPRPGLDLEIEVLIHRPPMVWFCLRPRR